MHYGLWIGFLVFVALMVSLDLGVFHRRAHAVRTREALVWTFFWIALALTFNVLLYFLYEQGWATEHAGRRLSGTDAAAQFLTAYVLEKSLSIDNVFVIALIFAYFNIPPARQHRLLFWGILGAVVLRGAMIALGAVLLARFEWVTYVFGALLLVSAVKMMRGQHEDVDPENNLLVRLVRRLYPVCHDYSGGKFFVIRDGRRAATPMLLALVLVETSDVVFAVDSIPAVFAVTRDPFIVFTSNVFAILGLRSMYFVLAAALDKFRYLKQSLVAILALVGVKMLLAHHYPIPNLVSLTLIFGILAAGLVASLLASRREPLPETKPLGEIAETKT